MKKLALIAALASIAFVSPAIAGNCKNGDSIADLAIATPALSTLVEAVVKADLVATLDGNRNYTVFAPTNAAFDAAAVALVGPGTTGSELVAALSVEDLTAVLLYHLSPGERFSPDVLNSSRVRMIDKNFTFPSTQGGVPFINDAPIAIPDIDACNGVVHVIGGVLLPPSD